MAPLQRLFDDRAAEATETADNRYELGTDTFVVKNGKIVTQTFAGKSDANRGPLAGETVGRFDQMMHDAGLAHGVPGVGHDEETRRWPRLV